MAFSTTNNKHFDRVVETTDWSYREQQAGRETHQRLVRHLAGQYYPTRLGEQGIETSINLLSMAKRAMSRHLISKAPRALAVSHDPSNSSFAEDAALAVNRRIKRSKLDVILEDVVDQSMISYGTFMLGADYVGHNDGMKLELVMKSIDKADHVFDANAIKLEEADLQGHKFLMPLTDVREHPFFDEERRMRVDAETVEVPEDQKTDIVRPGGSMRSRLYDYVEIWCIYERRRNKIWYFPVRQQDILLAEMDWTGPEHGPYRYLYYETLPNHAVPISPLMHLLKKHRAFNALDVKSIHQQERAKGNLVYTNASKLEAQRIVKSRDNESVLQDNGAVRWTHIGGAHQGTVAMAEKQARDFSYQAFNMDQYAGLKAQSDTLGQERLLRGASNEMIEDMGKHAYKLVKGVIEDIFWFDIRDPDPSSEPIQKAIPGTDIEYPSEWGPEKRQMVMDMKFEIDVEPYSYRERSPESRLADILAAIQVYMGVKDEAQAQGITMDVQELLDLIARYRNLPELKDVLLANQDPRELTESMGQRGSAGTQQDNGPKRYINENQSDGSGERTALMNALSQGVSDEGVI